MLSGTNYGFYAIKNDGGDGGFQIYDGFDDAEKWQAISSGIGKATAGPGDVSNVTSAGPFTINPGDSVKVAFAILAADDKSMLDAAVNQARIKYQEIIVLDVKDNNSLPTEFSLQQNYPNPFNPSTTIEYVIPNGVRNLVTLKVYDLLGNEVTTLVNEEKSAGTYQVVFDASALTSGIYFYKLQASSFSQSRKMILLNSSLTHHNF